MAKVIAEIGCNHKGDIDIAKDLIKTAKEYCGAYAVKFQKRNAKELLSEAEYNSPHPNPDNSYGKTYGAHREFLEFDIKQNIELKEYCESLGIVYSTSVWDLTSAKEVTEINPEFIKIGSASNLNKPILDYLCENFSGDIHVSLGMTTKKEIETIVKFFEDKKRANSLILYSCTSGYPVEFSDVCLKELTFLKENYKNRVKALAFSGHHLGIAVDIAAMTLGAEYLERHYTLNRTWKGTDHAASLEPDGLRRLCRDVENVSLALQYKQSEILPVEEVQRRKLKANSIKW